jgi:hypothetical protein
MGEMTMKDYGELVALLDGRIDKLTTPIPSKQILRFAEAIRSAKLGDEDSVGTFNEEDYTNLLQAQRIVNEVLPQIMENIRARSVDPESGWRFQSVTAGHGDADLCAICRNPYQHFHSTVNVHCIDLHPNAYLGVCRECVRNYAPLAFCESEGVEEWLRQNRYVCDTVETDRKTAVHRVALIDAIRKHAHSTHYFSKIVQQSSEWAKGAFGEWR